MSFCNTTEIIQTMFKLSSILFQFFKVMSKCSHGDWLLLTLLMSNLDLNIKEEFLKKLEESFGLTTQELYPKLPKTH